jgi:tRNA(Ile)-lysidine synthase
MTTCLPERVEAHVRRLDLFPEPGLALLAVSGGPDSVALLDLFARLAPALRLDLAVGHVDHGIFADSAEVAEQVRVLARRLGVCGYVSSLGLGPGASETRAREGRYAALGTLKDRIGARYLVTAHHADDQVETVLFRILRGTGMAGLAGIASRRSDGVVRPLLPFTKRELVDWVGDRLPVHHDVANTDPAFHRSWIRHDLMPLLRARFGPELDAHLLSLARHAEADRGAWSALLKSLPELNFRAEGGVVEVDRSPLQKYDKRLSEALLRAAVQEAGRVLGPRRAAKLRAFLSRAQSGRHFELGDRWVAEIAFRRLRIFRFDEPGSPPNRTILQWSRHEAGRVRWGSWEVTWSRSPAGPLGRGGFRTWVTGAEASLRAFKPGDRMRPLGGVGHRRVTRLLMESGVPRSQRDRYPVLMTGAEIVWVPGVCRADVAVPRVGEMAVCVDARSG